MAPEKPRRRWFNELDVVMVCRPVEASRRFESSPGVGRSPRVGDRATILHVYSPDEFAVECVNADGLTVWLADFSADELTLDESGDLPPPASNT